MRKYHSEYSRLYNCLVYVSVYLVRTIVCFNVKIPDCRKSSVNRPKVKYYLDFLCGLCLIIVTPIIHGAGLQSELFKINDSSQSTQFISYLEHLSPAAIQPLQQTNSADSFRETVFGESDLQYLLKFNSEASINSQQFGSVDQLAVDKGMIWVTLYVKVTQAGFDLNTEQFNIELDASDESAVLLEPDKQDPELLHIRFVSSAGVNTLQPGSADTYTNQQHIATLKKNESMTIDIVIDSEDSVSPASFHLTVKLTNEKNLSQNSENKTAFSDILAYRAYPEIKIDPAKPDYFAINSSAIDLANAGTDLVSGVFFTDPVLEIPIKVFSQSPVISVNYISEPENSGNPGNDVEDDYYLYVDTFSEQDFEESFTSTTETTETTQPENVFSEEAFPATNRDIDALLQAANSLRGMSKICDEYECPELSCDTARQLLQSLFDAKVYLRYMQYHLGIAFKLHSAHWTNLMEQNITTGTNQYHTLVALAWQQYLHSFGSTMLKIASFYDFVQGFVEDVAEGSLSDDMSPQEMLEKIKGAYDALKDLEAGIDTVTSNLNEGKGTGTAVSDFEQNLTGKFIQDQKTALENAKTIIEEAVKLKKDWRAALKKGGAIGALGQIAAQYLEGYSETLIEERIQHYNQLVNDAAAEEKAISEAFLQKQKVGKRLAKVNQTKKILDSLYEAIQPCIKKICKKLVINFKATGDIAQKRFDEPHPLNPKISNFQPALVFAKGKLVEITHNLLKTLEVREGCPEEEVIYIFETIDDNSNDVEGAFILEPPVDTSLIKDQNSFEQTQDVELIFGKSSDTSLFLVR